MLHERRNRFKFRKRKILQWIVFTALLIYLLATFISQQTLLNNTRARYYNAQSRLVSEESLNRILQEEYESIGTPEFHIRIAREILGFVHPDEIVFHESRR